MMGGVTDDEWDDAGARFVRGYETLRGRTRTHVIDQHLAGHLTPPPARVVDVGGGAGTQSIPLARRGYDVTIADPSAAMLERAREALTGEPPEVRDRVHLVQCAGEDASAVLGGGFAGVLCHGVIVYVDDRDPFLDSLCALAATGGIVSIVAKNRDVLAAFPAMRGDWTGALAAFDDDRQVNALGIETRADRVDELGAELARRAVEPEAWYGVRLFTDSWPPERPADDPEDLVLAVELEASRRDPYRQLSRLFHLVGRRR
jgi:S-adenosylmethionine-dependent methyltransferase